MNKEVLTNQEVSDALHCLFHCARKDSNYETQYEQFRLVYDYINQLEKENGKAIFIDTQDMEERCGEQLYQEYLEKENKELKEKVEQLEEENKNKNKMYERLLFQVNVCIRYIKNMDLTKKSTSCENYHYYDFIFILATLKQGKGGSNG